MFFQINVSEGNEGLKVRQFHLGCAEQCRQSVLSVRVCACAYVLVRVCLCVCLCARDRESE